MTKQEFIKEIATKSGETQKTVEAIVKAFQEVVIEAVAQGDKIALQGFGSFERAETKERKVQVNPKQPELGTKTIPAGFKPKFKASPTFKEAVNK